MLLNCDLGEGFGCWSKGKDAEIMPYIDVANIACGFHAGDPTIMQKTISLAKKNKVTIAAHPGYSDLAGFGRRSIKVSEDELFALLIYQIGALQALATAQQVKVTMVKPHGALYNDMMADIAIFASICQAIAQLDNSLILIIQALPDTTMFQKVADDFGLSLQFEAFADRNYQSNGLLVPRNETNASITETTDIVKRCQHLFTHQELLDQNGIPLSLKVDTLCIHGDHHNAVDISKALRSSMKKNIKAN